MNIGRAEVNVSRCETNVYKRIQVFIEPSVQLQIHWHCYKTCMATFEKRNAGIEAAVGTYKPFVFWNAIVGRSVIKVSREKIVLRKRLRFYSARREDQ